MSSELGFHLNDIKLYLLSNGGRVEYHELVKAFRHFLSDPKTQIDARNAFKDYVNRLATVSTHQNQKYLVLRPEFLNPIPDMRPQVVSEPNVQRMQSFNRVGLPITPKEPPIGLPLVETRRSHQTNHEMKAIDQTMISPSRQRTDPTIGLPMSPSRAFSFSHHFSESDVPPQPPPRRRNSAVGSKAKLEHRIKSFDESDRNGDKYSEDNSKDSPSHQIEKLKEIHELSTKTPGRVKERAQKIDKMASLTELKPPMPSTNATTPTTRPKSRNGTFKETEENDSGSVQAMDPLRRKWIISASNCDYNCLVQCLTEEPKLSAYKDFTSGYTALHWAAKFGKPDVVKLIAGKYGVNPNMKSHGGYTPLHLAAINQNEELMELLIKTYHADPNIRDNSGKRPAQYLSNKSNAKTPNSKSNGIQSQPQNSFGSSVPKSITARITSESSSANFIRIGSMKAASKVKKITGIGPKSWGSHESISENGFNKKSKKKKNLKRFPTPERQRDSDSDSAYGFQ